MKYLLRVPLAADPRFGIHAQWFAAEDEGRTEDPTEKKIRKAREEGKVAKSGDITGAVVLLFGLGTLTLMARTILRTILEMMRYFLTVSTQLDITTTGIIIPAFAGYVARIALPVMAASAVAAFMGNVVQVGFLFSSKPVTPDFSRIMPNVAKWAQRSFFSAEAAFNLGKSLFKIAIIALLAYLNIRAELPRLANAVKLTPYRGLALVAGIAIRLMFEATLAFLLLSIPDYYFQRRQHRESLKMSRHELKEEHKETEGDPLIRSRLRQRMQEVLGATMARQVPEADVVITNPTHYAVALKWDNLTMNAPQVTAKGADNMALRIKEIARDNDVALVENRPLARALYDNIELGDPVPEEYWDVISVILAEVYRLSGRAV